MGDYHAQVTGSDFRQGRLRLGAQGGLYGLTFVCLSRAKRLVDLMVDPMGFDRIGNLGNSSTMKARLQVITGGWCVAKKRYIQRTPPPMEKKKRKKGKTKRGAAYRTREL